MALHTFFPSLLTAESKIPIFVVPTMSAHHDDLDYFHNAFLERFPIPEDQVPLESSDPNATIFHFPGSYYFSDTHDTWSISDNDIIRLIYRSAGDATVYTNCYYKIDGEHLRYPTRTELNNVKEWKKLNHYVRDGVEPDTCYNDQVENIEFNSIIKWTYNGEEYAWDTYTYSDFRIMPVAIINNFIFPIMYDSYRAEIVGHYLWNLICPYSPIGLQNNYIFDCPIQRAEPGYKTLATNQHPIIKTSWIDRLVLYVDGIKWQPEREKQGKSHPASYYSPCEGGNPDPTV